eukprot:TRINITY_DN93541_c0_g1_i1.p1 TRINITY_DN93541_c0_g1~~TRINITY_DN93541_c0_g1_i1.p1  ORF type:complete len:235 (+),score=22.07 TRINITY_DN93541_c0_g1_i1:2-706(+)
MLSLSPEEALLRLNTPLPLRQERTLPDSTRPALDMAAQLAAEKIDAERHAKYHTEKEKRPAGRSQGHQIATNLWGEDWEFRTFYLQIGHPTASTPAPYHVKVHKVKKVAKQEKITCEVCEKGTDRRWDGVPAEHLGKTPAEASDRAYVVQGAKRRRLASLSDHSPTRQALEQPRAHYALEPPPITTTTTTTHQATSPTTNVHGGEQEEEYQPDEPFDLDNLPSHPLPTRRRSHQ